jgi:hypothetical protein
MRIYNIDISDVPNDIKAKSYKEAREKINELIFIQEVEE